MSSAAIESEAVVANPAANVSENATTATLTQASRPDFYIPGLDGIRAIAFLAVFIAHAGLDKIVPGGLGVTVFFFLSGYLITTLLRLEAVKTGGISLKRFYLRRAFRILPPLYLTLAVAYALGATGILSEAGNAFGLLSASAYFYNYTDLLHKPAILPNGTGVLWSLMIEEHFYFVFPLVYLGFIDRRLSVRRQVNILTVACASALLWRVVLVYYFHTPLLTLPRWTYSASDARFDAILFGCILAIRNNPSLRDPSPILERYKGRLASAGIILLLATLLVREPHFRETIRYTLQSVALYPIFYYCASTTHTWQTNWLAWKPLRYLGWISYSMYLFHFVPLHIGFVYFPNHLILVAIVSFAIALLYSWLVRIWVELPSRKWRASAERRFFAQTTLPHPIHRANTSR